MFHHLDKYARDDALVKLVFDHLRNFGLCCVVLGAAAWKQKHAGSGWGAIWNHFSAAALGFTGFGLLWVNHENLFSKLRESAVRLRLRFSVVVLYAVVVGQLLSYLTAAKSGA